MTRDSDLSKWITTKQASELTGYDPAHVRLLIRQDKVKGKKFSTVWMVDRESIKECADRVKQLGPAKHDSEGKWFALQTSITKQSSDQD